MLTEDEALCSRLFEVEAYNPFWENVEYTHPLWQIKDKAHFGSEGPEYPIWELLEKEESTSEESDGY